MPYTTERRGDEWCVLKESDGQVMGCHASKARAMAQQSALYANESQTAAVSPMRLEVSSVPPDVDHALVASLDAISERLQATEDVIGQVVDALARVVEMQGEDRQAFTDALTAAANRPEPEIHVHVPELAVPTVNVHVPKSQILVPVSPAPIVNVTLPGSKRTVKFARDPLTGQVSEAEIVEDLE